MHREPLIRAICLSILMIPALAVSSPTDYAYRAELGEVDNPLQRVVLPLEVILALTRADLGDLAVFDADGKQLVHTVTRAATPTEELSRALPFHEFSRFQRQHSKTVTKREQSQQAGSLSELETTQTVPVQTLRKDYLIELVDGEDRPDFERIELQWLHEPAEQILELKIEAGNALDELRVIKARKSLTNLDSSDSSWRSIMDIPAGNRYLRLTPIGNVTRFELQQVSGHYRQTGRSPKLSHQLTTQRLVEDDTTYYSIAVPAKVYAESLRIIPSAANSVITGDLVGRQVGRQVGDEARVIIRRNFRQHNIASSEVRPSEPIRLAQRSYSSLAFTSANALSAEPAIELIYPQYELLFLGDDNGPYSLAWGNHQSAGPASDLTAILKGSLQQAQRDAGVAGLGNIEESGGAARLAPQPDLAWEKWLLWTLLIFAVIVTGRMALNLYREMNAAPTT
jgi:hypothetical protein